MADDRRTPLLDQFYLDYLASQDTATFIKRVSLHYTTATLSRLAACGERDSRRGSVFALGFIGGYECNAAFGRALHDADRGVRTLAENGIRSIWCRAGNDVQRRQLEKIIRLNTAGDYPQAIRLSGELIEAAPWFAEVWNQRGIAHFRAGQFEESIRDCRQTLEINAYHFGAATGLGFSHLALNQRAAALEGFRRALVLNPNLEGVRARATQLERLLERES